MCLQCHGISSLLINTSFRVSKCLVMLIQNYGDIVSYFTFWRCHSSLGLIGDIISILHIGYTIGIPCALKLREWMLSMSNSPLSHFNSCLVICPSGENWQNIFIHIGQRLRSHQVPYINALVQRQPYHQCISNGHDGVTTVLCKTIDIMLYKFHHWYFLCYQFVNQST